MTSSGAHWRVSAIWPFQHTGFAMGKTLGNCSGRVWFYSMVLRSYPSGQMHDQDGARAEALATIGATLPEMPVRGMFHTRQFSGSVVICLKHYWPKSWFQASANIDPDEKQASQGRTRGPRGNIDHRRLQRLRTGDEPLATTGSKSREPERGKKLGSTMAREEQGRTA